MTSSKCLKKEKVLCFNAEYLSSLSQKKKKGFSLKNVEKLYFFICAIFPLIEQTINTIGNRRIILLKASYHYFLKFINIYFIDTFKNTTAVFDNIDDDDNKTKY